MKYRKKPVEIEAVQFNGASSHATQIHCWMAGKRNCPDTKGTIHTRDIVTIDIETLEGFMTAKQQDWIIKGVAGEFYPCKPDIFKQTYELVE